MPSPPSPSRPARRRLLTAAEAAAVLGVRRATLYAYVSRGLLRSQPDPEGRGHLYPAEDVESLGQRAAARRDPPRAARGALDWGLPVLDSRLTLIAGGRLYYRGRDAVELARGGETLERVAALLWRERLDEPLPPPAPHRLAALLALEPRLAASRAWRPFQRLQAWLPAATAEDPAAYDLRPAAVAATGAWLLQLLAAIAAGTTDHLRGEPPRPRAGKAAARPPEAMATPGAGTAVPTLRVAEVLARAWVPAAALKREARRPPSGSRKRRRGGEAGRGGGADRLEANSLEVGHGQLARQLDAALVLSADHELNVSAFTARCVASAGAPPQAAVTAALAALGGSRHGGQTERVETLLAELSPPQSSAARGDDAERTGGVSAVLPSRTRAGAIRDALAGRLRRGEQVPGFGHPLYPEGDPRARLLLDLAAANAPASPHTGLAAELTAAAFELLGERPNLDFGLVTLAQALDLPAGAALALFAIGRSAGWIAHAIEQYQAGGLIRPRARYLGPDPIKG
jgi:citrate synthase